MNYTDEQFDQLEQEERSLTDEAIAAMLLILASTKGNLEKELRSFYQQYGKDGVVTYQEARKWVSEKDHRKRLTVLLLFIATEFNSLSSKLSPKFESMLKEVVLKESGFFNVDLDASDLVTRGWGVDDLTWLDRLEDDVELWSVYISNDLKQGMLKRKDIDEILSQVDKRFMTIERVIRRLGLTESTAVGSMARKTAFKELGITKYQFYTRADERTCEICGSMHGLKFPISAYEIGVTASPLHTNCRCWEVPIWD